MLLSRPSIIPLTYICAICITQVWQEYKSLRFSAADHSYSSLSPYPLIATVVASTASVAIWVVGILLALGQLGLDLAPLIAGAGIAGVALGFGAQNLVKDCITGLFMLLEDQYGIGDSVDLGVASGSVEQVSLRTTVMRGQDGTVWHVPNGEVRRVGNRTKLWSVAVLDVVVAYDADLDPDPRGRAGGGGGVGRGRALQGRCARRSRAARGRVGVSGRGRPPAARADRPRRPVPACSGRCARPSRMPSTTLAWTSCRRRHGSRRTPQMVATTRIGDDVDPSS